MVNQLHAFLDNRASILAVTLSPQAQRRSPSVLRSSRRTSFLIAVSRWPCCVSVCCPLYLYGPLPWDGVALKPTFPPVTPVSQTFDLAAAHYFSSFAPAIASSSAFAVAVSPLLTVLVSAS